MTPKSIRGYVWKMDETQPNVPLTERLFLRRGLKTPSERESFLKPQLARDLHDPFAFSDMERTVHRITKSIQAKEKIIVFGDYDVDGITATAILVQTLKTLGAHVSYRLPHRIKDGYGLRMPFIEEFKKLGVGLVITVDCGISCADEVAAAQAAGIDVIITDHHTIPERIPPAIAILHPLMETAGYPFQWLTGAGVAFKLAHALWLTTKPQEAQTQMEYLLDLAAIGTVADCGQLLGENRLIVREGLTRMRHTHWHGLRALLLCAGVDLSTELDTDTIGFRLAPLLNAAGRMDSPYFSLQLLLQQDGQRTAALAKKLEHLNKQRQNVTQTALRQTMHMMESQESHALLVAASPEWPVGIIGILAGKIADKYGKPAIVMAQVNGAYTGSARSIEGFNVTDAIGSQKKYLTHFGGHAQAAGFSVPKENLDHFINGVKRYGEKHLSGKKLAPTLQIEGACAAEEWTPQTFEVMQSIGPFGIGNTRPLLLFENFYIERTQRMGKERNHVRLNGRFGRHQVSAVGFHFNEQAGKIERLEGPVSCVGTIMQQTWQGRKRTEIHLSDLRPMVER